MKKLILVCLLALTASVYTWGYTSGSCTVTFSESTITVSGTGAMADYANGNESDYEGKKTYSTYTSLIIEEGVTHIGAYAFGNFTYITTIRIRSTKLTSIGANAFTGCTNISDVYYISSPNDWASIDFKGDTRYSQPFAASSAANRKYYFYGSDTETVNLVFTPGLTVINKYAFYNANTIQSVNIPNSVTSIGNYALDCKITNNLAINRSTPPTTGSTSITFKSANSTYLYVPSGCTSNYTANPWKDATGTNGAKTVTGQSTSGTMSDAIGEGITWNLATNGTLTLNATGVNKIVNIISDKTDSYKQYPWQYFRRLVHKVILRGEISELTETFTYCFGLTEVTLDQTTIPTATTATVTPPHKEINYNNLFNQRDNVILNIKAASLTDVSADNLGSAPWNNVKLDIQLSEAVTVTDGADNRTLLSNINTYVEKPFDMNVSRSTFSNAYYNTFCSPINMNSTMVADLFGANTSIHAFTGSEYDNGYVLNFADSQDYIEAGVPYLIWPENNTTLSSFTNVNPSDVASAEGTVDDSNMTFHGTFAPREVSSKEAEDKSFIFLLADNYLAWAGEGTLKGMRAYWLMKNGSPAQAAKRPVMKIGNEAMGIDQVQSNDVQSTKVLKDGQLYLMYEGRMYDVRGMRVD